MFKWTRWGELVTVTNILYLSACVLFLVSLSSLFLVSPVKASDSSWTIMEPMPTARGWFGVAVVDGKIYAISGGSSGINEMYDPATNTWTTKSSMPTPRSSFGIAVVNGKIYCIGGSPAGWEYTGVNEVYDPATDTWENRTSMPSPRSGLEANVVDGKIYMIGGGRRPPFDTFRYNEVYDPVNDSWTIKAAIPAGVKDYASAVIGNKIYILGGAVGSFLNQIYDAETDTWSSGASLPIGVDSAAAGVTAGNTDTERIYVLGGKQNLDPVNLNQVYDPTTDTWVAGPAMPTARFGHGVAIINASLYAIGGQEGWHFPVSAANERYTPANFIPEFPSWTITPLLITATMVAIIFKKRLLRDQVLP